ncbi:MAG: GNAT family N-acetyltransferase [Lachnospiraceae bacterium]|nr:GNAT family N-acetyltransferase [Lachnospiraceae bacterium]
MNFQYKTKRLILATLTAEASKNVLRFLQNNRADFEKYDGIKPENYYTQRYQKTLLTYDFNMSLHQKSFRYWLMEKNNPAKVIGTISIQRIERGIFQTCTIGYKMDHEFRKKGYMYEALCEVISLIFHDLKLHRIEAYVKPGNLASIRLLEKLGFQKEGTAFQYIFINGAWEDHLRFSLISSPECKPKN